MEEGASLAHVSIPIDKTSVVVVAVAAAVHFMKWQWTHATGKYEY
jgi:hypothetical protein